METSTTKTTGTKYYTVQNVIGIFELSPQGHKVWLDSEVEMARQYAPTEYFHSLVITQVDWK